MSLSIRELREREANRLAAYHDANYTAADLEYARKLMRSFYRLCGLAETNLYLANDSRTCNRQSTKDSEERERRWANRLSNQFKAFAGLELCYCGYAPSIGVKHVPSGAFSEKIALWFYH